MLWHQREVELSGVLHRIRVPLIGAVDAPVLSHELTSLLAPWWSGPAVLSPSIQVTSVVADVQCDDLGACELVLLVTTDALAEDHSIVNMRMIRDLRRALRLHRLRSSAQPELAAA